MDELLERDPLDSTHLFFEELRRISRAMREVEAADLTDEVLDSLLPVLDQLSSILHTIEQKRRKRMQNGEPERLTV